MTESPRPNRYDAARERLRAQDEEGIAAMARRPFGAWLAKSFATALAAGLVFYVIGGWSSALFIFSAWFLTDVAVRIWARHRAGRQQD